jgi:hypothetical protein
MIGWKVQLVGNFDRFKLGFTLGVGCKIEFKFRFERVAVEGFYLPVICWERGAGGENRDGEREFLFAGNLWSVANW